MSKCEFSRRSKPRREKAEEECVRSDLSSCGERTIGKIKKSVKRVIGKADNTVMDCASK
jgi:hypothetical protein